MTEVPSSSTDHHSVHKPTMEPTHTRVKQAPVMVETLHVVAAQCVRLPMPKGTSQGLVRSKSMSSPSQRFKCPVSLPLKGPSKAGWSHQVTAKAKALQAKKPREEVKPPKPPPCSSTYMGSLVLGLTWGQEVKPDLMHSLHEAHQRMRA